MALRQINLPQVVQLLLKGAVALFLSACPVAADELVVNNLRLKGIRAVVRTASDTVAIRHSEGIAQEKIERLPADFLAKWNIEAVQRQATDNAAADNQKLLKESVGHSTIVGGPARYALYLVESTQVLFLYVTAPGGPAKGNTVLAMIPVKELDDFLGAISEFVLLANTATKRPQKIADFGSGALYFKPPNFLTWGRTAAFSPGEESNLSFIMFYDNVLLETPMLPFGDIQRMQEVLMDWRKSTR